MPAKRQYRHRSKSAERYVEIPASEVPDGIKWRPGPQRPSKLMTILYSTGNIYKLMRELETGAVTYYQLADTRGAATPKEKIDEEPTRGHQVRYRVGAQCWYVDAGRWYLVRVIKRTGEDKATYGQLKRITIKTETGWDADRTAPWPGPGEELEFPSKANHPLFQRLRPLKDRYQ